MLDLLAEWRAQGKSAVLITHRLAEVMRICDQATILRDGRNVAELVTAEVDEHQLVEAMLGASVEPMLKTTQDAATRRFGETALEVRGLADRHHVRGVSFAVRSGEILGLVALEGQGQDRLFDLLSGARRPVAGEILVAGKPCRFHSPYDAVRRGVVLVPGDRLIALLPNQSVHHNLALPLFNHLRRWLRIPADERPRVQRAIERLSIDVRGVAGAQALRRQPAKGRAWSLVGQRFSHAALLRSDARHRHPDQTRDLRPAARTGGPRRSHRALHQRAG